MHNTVLTSLSFLHYKNDKIKFSFEAGICFYFGCFLKDKIDCFLNAVQINKYYLKKKSYDCYYCKNCHQLELTMIRKTNVS